MKRGNSKKSPSFLSIVCGHVFRSTMSCISHDLNILPFTVCIPMLNAFAPLLGVYSECCYGGFGSGSGLINAEAGCIQLVLAIQDHALFLNWMMVQ